jgi:hypothetical protein
MFPRPSLADCVLPLCRMDPLALEVLAALLQRDSFAWRWLGTCPGLLYAALASAVAAMALATYGKPACFFEENHAAVALAYFCILLATLDYPLGHLRGYPGSLGSAGWASCVTASTCCTVRSCSSATR